MILEFLRRLAYYFRSRRFEDELDEEMRHRREWIPWRLCATSRRIVEQALPCNLGFRPGGRTEAEASVAG